MNEEVIKRANTDVKEGVIERANTEVKVDLD
jgi:hypothetical protein